MSKIAVFDSGLGGLTVLASLVRLMSEEDYIYFGDSAHAPFGDRSDEELLRLCTDISRRILEEGPVKCFVVACNTTTTRVLPRLEALFPEESFIGISPAVGEAARGEPGGHILVLATGATAKSKFLAREVEKYSGEACFDVLAAPGIVPYVEGGEESGRIAEYLEGLLCGYRGRIDAVVLGCTHFPFVKKEIEEALGGDVRFYDGAEGLAQKTLRFLEENGLRATDGRQGSVTFLNSDPAKQDMEEKLFYEYQRDTKYR